MTPAMPPARRPEFRQLSLLDAIGKKKAEEALAESLPHVPDIARATVKIAEKCGPNEFHLLFLRGNVIPLLAVSKAMHELGKRRPQRILVPVTEVGTYERGELENIVRQSISHLPPGSAVHYIDECKTGSNSSEIAKVLQRIVKEKGHSLKIDLLVDNGGRDLFERENRSYYRALREADAKLHPVGKISWLDYPAIGGYKWAKDFLKCVSDLSVVGVHKRDEKKIKKVFNAVMWKKNRWMRQKRDKRVRIVRFDSREYMKRPSQVLKGLYTAFKETGLHEPYGVSFNRKKNELTIHKGTEKERRVSHTEFLNTAMLAGPAGMLVDPKYRIDKYTLLRLGYPIATAAVGYRKKLFEEIRKQVRERNQPEPAA